jgi:hypothetical protein
MGGGGVGNVKSSKCVFFWRQALKIGDTASLLKMMQDHTFIENFFIQHLLCAVVLC